ncbi:MAG: galactose mutarotase [Gammaproteobacteria bacterium]|nr:galactose mutarotase [Gammaproteobacteria bacterium]
MIRTIGELAGKAVQEAVLRAGDHRVCILNYGCVIRQWQLQLPGELRELVLGFEQFADYPLYSRCFGILAGRVANRTRAGQFELDAQHYQLSLNEGAHHLHGGDPGLGGRLWQIKVNADATEARLHYHSPDGEAGYPGNVDFTVIFTLGIDGLRCEMRATPDRPTPVNLAQHNYYNLDGGGKVLEHTLQLAADRYMPVDHELIPTGELRTVSGSRFDFREAKKIAAMDKDCQGYDHNMVLCEQRDRSVAAATLVSSDGLVELQVTTSEPGIQLYTAAGLDVPVPGLGGAKYSSFGGICLEAQHFPDSLNHPEYPGIICTREQPYHQSLHLGIRHPGFTGRPGAIDRLP